MNIKKFRLICFLALIIAISVFVGYRVGNAVNKEAEIYCTKCPMCGHNEVKLYPINNSFYIECKWCDLRTGYYSSEYALTHDWNKLCGYEAEE